MLNKTKVAFWAILALGSAPALASSTSPNAALPYESWLLTLQQSFTGPVAMSVALLGMVAAGSSLIFLGGEMGRFIRTLIYLVMVMALLLGSNSLISNFFNGAVVMDRQQLEETLSSYVDPLPAKLRHSQSSRSHLQLQDQEHSALSPISRTNLEELG